VTDGLTNKNIKHVYKESIIKYFNDDLKYLIEDVLKDLYLSDSGLMKGLQLSHVDRAIFKYRQAKEKTYIHNTRQYFKACLLSAIKESGLDDLTLLD
jgi:hypothetical protein